MQANYLDRIGECHWPNGHTAESHNIASDGVCTDCGKEFPKKPADCPEVIAELGKLRPEWRADHDYPGVVSIYPEYSQDPDGPVFVLGTANETWAADFYPSADSLVADRSFVGFDTGIDETELCPEVIARAVVAEVEQYLKRRPVRGEFLDAMRDFRKAARALNAAWEKLDAEDSSVLVDNYPFAHSFDEIAAKIDWWVDDARRNLNDEVES